MATTPNYGWVTPAPTDFVTDLPADFEVFADAVDADLAGLLGGTAGQVLVKNSGTDHDYDFAADPVSDIITTAGDVLYGTAADTLARLGIGTAGQVLAVNGTADAPEWITPSGGSNWSLLNAGGTSLTGSSVTVSGISGKEKIMVLVTGASTDQTSSLIRFRVNGLSTAIYNSVLAQFTAVSTYAASNLTGDNNLGINEINLANYGANASGNVNGAITLTGCNSSGVKQFEFAAAGSTGGSSNNTFRTGQGFIAESATISSITIFVSSGTFDAGTVFVYTTA